MADFKKDYVCYHDIPKITSDEIQIIEKRMQDPKFTYNGILAKDETLMEVYLKDQRILKKYGVTCKQIADRLQMLIDKLHQKNSSFRNFNQKIIMQVEKEKQLIVETCEKMDKLKISPVIGNPEPRTCLQGSSKLILVEDRYAMAYISWGGAQICPFQPDSDKSYHGYDYGSYDYLIYDTKTDEFIKFNNLLVHMIREHSFFEGSVPHRLDPEVVIKLLEIKPAVDYEPKYLIENVWTMKMGQSHLDDDQFVDHMVSIPNFPQLSYCLRKTNYDDTIELCVYVKEKFLDNKQIEIIIDDCKLSTNTKDFNFYKLTTYRKIERKEIVV